MDDEQDGPKKRQCGIYQFGGNSGAGWKPGKSGNPAGRPKNKRTIPDILRYLGEGKIKDFKILPPRMRGALLKMGEEITVEEARLVICYVWALKGESWANHYISDRTEGKVPNQIKLDFDPDEINLYLNDLNPEEPEQTGPEENGEN